MPQAMRNPVKSPARRQSDGVEVGSPSRAPASRRSSMGSASSPWRWPARCSMAPSSPSRHSATEHHSVDVSMAANFTDRF